MKKKMLKIIGIILIAVGIVSLCMCMYLNFRKNNIMDGPGMIYEPDVISVSYSHGGSSLGDTYQIDLYDGSFTVVRCEGNGYPTSEKSYDVGALVYQQIEDVVDKYNMKSWTDLEKSDLIELDGPSTYFSITFKDGFKIELHDTDEWPTGAYQAINEILAIFEENMN